MDLTKITKTAVKLVVGGSVSYTVSNAVMNNTTSKNKMQAAEVLVGSFVLGYMVADYAENYAAGKVDEVKEWWATTTGKTSTE